MVTIVVAGLFFRQIVEAVHDTGQFELDGNSVNGTTHDWEDVYNGTAGGATAISFTAEMNLNSSIFTGGGSKDGIDMNQWAWKDGAGGLPDKDNLLHSFAARYSLPPDPDHCPSGGAATCEVLFFGSDRFDNSGDAQQGFWFFQNPVGTQYDSDGDGMPDTNCPQKIGGGTGFCDPATGAPASHRLGDLLIVSDFSNGGTTSTINVYRWNPAATGNLEPLAASNAANCATRSDADPFCGLVNSGTVASPWPFLDKSGSSSPINGELYEGGVNLSLLGLASECFSTVASETRSSTSTTATLKDFVMGTFGRCESGISTTPKDGAGADIPANGLSIGAGSVQVTDAAHLVVSGVQTFSGSIKFYLCGPIASGTCTSGGTLIDTKTLVNVASPVDTLSAAATVTSAGRYCWRGEFEAATANVPNSTESDATECFVVNPVMPTIPTVASDTVTIGGSVSDQAFLGGTANRPGDPVINPTTAGAVAGGTITFRLYGPNDASCTGNPVYTNTVAVTGNGTYGSGSFTPTAAGTYRWIASYSGDSPNTFANANACNDANEDVVVNPNTPSITTNASAPPPDGVSLGTAISDSATLSGTAAPSNGVFGTITFKAYGPHSNTTTCTTLAYTSVITITGDGTYSSANGNGGTFTPTQAGNYNWIASYTPGSGDVNNVAVSGTCGEANEGSLLIQLTPAVSTTQFFYPNDSATITVATGGGNLAGSVQFQAWTNNTCSGAPIINQTVVLGGAGALTKTVETTNTTVRVNGGSIYWKVDYTSTNTAHKNVTGACGAENSTINVTNQP